ncbi:putative E3 ubiquitin-protein ligase RF298 isoform X2 [Pyrus x bretschneideri]|uniref:putative E3 ubiquitin-protein ligase RF298 isoform X2 n=1 Tax=Pyrus x bretschneideri TaxID=225117 RepID=UPI002030FC91|nr:putative E3 ubiquitin-protein ligase RF298 isoform X2 [Pyrus x bretschneideri]
MIKMVNSGTGKGKGTSLGKGSKNKRKADPSPQNATNPGSPLTVTPQSELPSEECRKLSDNVLAEEGVVQPEEVEVGAFECADWDDPIACQLEELLLSYLQAIFRSAIKQVAEHGYSEEVAEKAVLRSGLYIGGKDPLANIVSDTLKFLKKEKDIDASNDQFVNLQHLVEYTMLEMISVVREVRLSLSVAEAMWWLLICDLNILLACTSEGDPFSALGFEESADSSSPQLSSEANSSETILPNPDEANSSKPLPAHAQSNPPETLKFGSFRFHSNSTHSHAPEETYTTEEKSGAGLTGRTKKELAALRKKSFHTDQNYSAYGKRGGFKSGKVTFGGFVLEKRLKPPSEIPGGRATVASSKLSAEAGSAIPSSVGRHSASTKISSASLATGGTVTLPISYLRSADPNLSQKSCLENKSGPKAKTPVGISPTPKTHDCCASLPCDDKSPGKNIPKDEIDELFLKVAPRLKGLVPLDYHAGIPYDKSLGKYVARDEKDELILKLVPRLEELQNEIESWTNWANEKIMQVSRRLSKERPELKILRQEKAEAEKFKKEKQMLEENTVKRISELENALNNATDQVEKATSNICRLELENSALKEERSTAKRMAIDSTARHQEALEREQNALKKARAWEGQRSALKEELETGKKKVAALQQDLGKAKNVHLQIEARWKREKIEREKILAQADFIRKDREQHEALTKLEEDGIKLSAEYDMQEYMEDIRKVESKLSELKLKSDSSRIAALRRGAAGTFGGSPSDRKSGMATKGNQNFTSLKKVKNSKDLRQDRECVMCLSEEMSVVFLPCAHQVVCANCNELHKKQGMKDCPSCRTPIQRRINVQYAHP